MKTTPPTDAALREVLLRALIVEPNRELAGAVLDRWDELTTGMPMSELLTAARSGSQKDVIGLYAVEIRRQSPALLSSPVWKIINEAIVARWSEKALVRIKREAWRLVDDAAWPHSEQQSPI